MRNPMQVKFLCGWALLVLIGVLSLVWLQPKQLRDARQELSGLQLRLARAEDGAAEIRALVADLKLLKESMSTIKNVPNQSQFAGMIQDLGEELESLGIEQREITNGGSVDIGVAQSIPMRIRMTSSFSGVFKTIQWIESLPRLIRVQRIQIEILDKTNPWESLVKSEITLDAVFALPEHQDTLIAVDAKASRE